MSFDYRPELEPIRVPLDRLALDPNNPRFLDRTPVPEHQLDAPGVQGNAQSKMESFNISELQDSILTNGWAPVDRIFVRKIGATDNYLVLEGNRRVTALQLLKRNDRLPDPLLAEVDPLEVMEILDEGSEAEIQAKIAYLLGVRHHGSLKEWSPFAQAHNIFLRYCRVGQQAPENFTWDEDIGKRVAATLSVAVKIVRTRLQVYQALRQIDGLPRVNAAGGVRGHYYTIVHEVISRPKASPLRQYIQQDGATFRLTDESLERIDNLCHFSEPARRGAPVKNQQEWRAFEKILKDPDEEKRAEMVARVVGSAKEHPTDVYAERAAELKVLRWDKWLEEVTILVRSARVADLEQGEEAKLVASRLATVIEELELLDGNME